MSSKLNTLKFGKLFLMVLTLWFVGEGPAGNSKFGRKLNKAWPIGKLLTKKQLVIISK
jgi:hypothetical protein